MMEIFRKAMKMNSNQQFSIEWKIMQIYQQFADFFNSLLEGEKNLNQKLNFPLSNSIKKKNHHKLKYENFLVKKVKRVLKCG